MIGTLCDNVQSNDTAMLFSHSNREMMKKRIPNMVITVGQILVGVSGNAFVIHIYRKNSSLRSRLFYFIPWLALFDIHAIITIGTFSILQDIFSICFPSLFLCQSMWFGDLLYIIWSIMFTSHCVPKILLRISEASAYS